MISFRAKWYHLELNDVSECPKYHWLTQPTLNVLSESLFLKALVECIGQVPFPIAFGRMHFLNRLCIYVFFLIKYQNLKKNIKHKKYKIQNYQKNQENIKLSNKQLSFRTMYALIFHHWWKYVGARSILVRSPYLKNISFVFFYIFISFWGINKHFIKPHTLHSFD